MVDLIKIMTYILTSGLVSAIVSSLVTWFSSERWVEKSRRKRYHSEKLNDSLMEWRKKLDSYLKMDSEYSHDSKRIEAKFTSKVSELPFYEFLETHLKKGHKDFFNSWNHLYENFVGLNKWRAQIIESIQKKFKDRVKKLDSYFWNYRLFPSHPEEYIWLDEIAKVIFYEFQMRLKDGVEWRFGKPEIDRFNSGGQLFHDFKAKAPSQRTLACFKEYNNIVEIEENLHLLIDDKEIIKTNQSFLSQLNNFNKEKEAFAKKIDNLIWHIELGNNFKGSCKNCPKWLRFLS